MIRASTESWLKNCPASLYPSIAFGYNLFHSNTFDGKRPGGKKFANMPENFSAPHGMLEESKFRDEMACSSFIVPACINLGWPAVSVNHHGFELDMANWTANIDLK